jgi:hypothetical protein
MTNKKSKDKGKSGSFAPLRMTILFLDYKCFLR